MMQDPSESPSEDEFSQLKEMQWRRRLARKRTQADLQGASATASVGDTGKSMHALDQMTIVPLGGGQEVGRSCILVKYGGKTVMLDCGLHAGKRGLDSLPFLDLVDLASVDLVLITHFHMDHVACLPYLTEKTDFRGKIFMTHPTKAVMRLLLKDYIRNIQSRESGGTADDDTLFTEQDLESCCAKCEVIDTHQTIEHNGIRFKAYTAGHVLGACMFLVEMNGTNILYTGDYSMESDRHLLGAEIPSVTPDVLIVESTFGNQDHERKEDREHRFTSTVEQIAHKQRGCCLVPVFALGRAQELLLILDEFWQSNRHLQHIPVYYANGMATRALRVYQTYINMMNNHIRARQLEKPFHFQHIRNLGNPEDIDNGKPCVVLASPGSIESGLSRRLFDRWCEGANNGVVLTGLLPEGTPARDITRTTSEQLIMGADGRPRRKNCRVEVVSFAAHVDFTQNYDFIEKVRPGHIVLVHGESHAMNGLKKELQRRVADWPEEARPSLYSPPNLSQPLDENLNHESTAAAARKGVVTLRFARRKRAKAVGRVAEQSTGMRVGNRIDGVVVSQEFDYRFMEPADVTNYTTLHTAEVTQKLHVPFGPKAELFVSVVRNIFEDVVQTVGDGPFDASRHSHEDSTLSICRAVFASFEAVSASARTNTVVLEWKATPAADIIADALIAAAMHAQASPHTVFMTSTSAPSQDTSGGERESLAADLMGQIRDILSLRFDDMEFVQGGELMLRIRNRLPHLAVSVDGTHRLGSPPTVSAVIGWISGDGLVCTPELQQVPELVMVPTEGEEMKADPESQHLHDSAVKMNTEAESLASSIEVALSQSLIATKRLSTDHRWAAKILENKM